tara:strand:- start:525 stop:644 length:120 start_codon:yes stop_codon:yes gene_type:complete
MSKEANKFNNGLLLIINGFGLIKKGLSLVKKDIFKRRKK